jgi:DNA-binding CsgD family transcriptional regulator
MNAKKNAFIGYLEVLKKKYSSLDKLSSKDQFTIDSFFKKILDKMPHGVGVLDYRTAKYLYVSENVAEVFTGLKNDILLEQGAQLWHTIMNDDDRFIIHNKIFPKMLNIMHSLPPDKISSYRFSYNYRIRHKSGRVIKILQNLVVLEADENNNPLIGLMTVTDITPYKTNDSLIFTITYPGKKKGEFIPHHESFNMSLEKPSGISVRENEVVVAIANGLSTAKIAEKLRISVYTVNAHRRNIFEKTGVKNVAELINYANSNGLV